MFANQHFQLGIKIKLDSIGGEKISIVHIVPAYRFIVSFLATRVKLDSRKERTNKRDPGRI